MLEELSSQQLYAWNWFEMHAKQRLQMVSFWLVGTAFITSAYVEAAKNDLPSMAKVIAALGATVSITFALLDARTRQLVQVAERALEKIEMQMIAAGAVPEIGLTTAASNAQRRIFQSYRFLIEGLEALAAVVFVLAIFR